MLVSDFVARASAVKLSDEQFSTNSKLAQFLELTDENGRIDEQKVLKLTENLLKIGVEDFGKPITVSSESVQRFGQFIMKKVARGVQNKPLLSMFLGAAARNPVIQDNLAKLAEIFGF